jgi:hypothetical protein
MSLNRFAKRRDSNDLLLAHAAREMGAQMEYAGPLDWWCGWRGHWVCVEIKNGRNPYTEEQKKFLARCAASGVPVWTWRTIEDVLASLNEIRL